MSYRASNLVVVYADRPFPMPTGAFSQTMNRHTVSSSALTTTTQSERGALLYLKAAEVVTSISFVSSSTAGASMTSQYFALRSLTGTVLAVTADDGATAWAASTAKTLALTSPYTVPADGWYYVCRNVTATTPPNASGAVVVGAVSGLAPFLAATFGTRSAVPSVGSVVAPTTATSVEYAYVA